MINHSLTRIENSRPMPLHSDYLAQAGVTHIVEGMAMITTMENGIAKVRPSTGTGTHGAFLGIAAETNRRQSTVVAVETVTVPASSPYTVNLAHNSADVNITVITSAGMDLAVSASAAAADNVQWLSTDADGLIFHSSHASNTYTVVYRYSPTLQEAYALMGDGNVLGSTSPGDAAQVMTVVTHGLVFTDQFNTGVIWNSVEIIDDIAVDQNGLFTRTGATIGETDQADLTNRIQVMQAPSVNTPFLGLLLL